jgi:cytohesin
MVNKLLKAGAPTEGLDQDKMTPLMCAEKRGYSEVVQLLRAAVPTPAGDYESRAASKLLGRNVLHWAAEDGEDLERYTLDKAALNQQDIVGRTPLHLAALSGCVHTMAQLLAAEPDTELTDELGQTPAHYASERDDPAILALLIGAKTDIEAADKWGRRPLHLAARQGRSGAVRALLEAGALLPADKESQTPLHLAVVGGHDEVVRAILETDRDRRAIDRGDDSQRTAIHLAAHDGRDSLLAILLKHVSDHSAAVVDMQDEMGKTALHLASAKGHLGVVRQLLDAGALAYRVDRDRYMAMHLAAEAGHGAIVGELLDALPVHVERCLDAWYPRLPNWASPEDGADSTFLEALAKAKALVQLPEDKRWVTNPDVWAPANRPALAARVVSELRTWDSDRHSIPSTALMRAVFGGHAGVVKLVLEKVPDMPLQAEQYAYANVLTLAAARGCAAVAALLIAAGSVVNAVTDGQNTALHEAAKGGHADVINVLLQNRGDPDLARLSDGSTPLHLAAEGGHEDAVRALADVAFLNAADDLGRTPLHRACLGRHETIVELLLDVDADVLARDANDATPIALAVDADFSEEMLGRMQEQVDRQRLREAAGY